MNHERLQQQLTARLTENYNDYCAALLTYDRQEIISRAVDIAHVQEAYEDVMGNHEFSERQVASFLQFENPLEVIASHWPDIPETVSDAELKLYPLMADNKPSEPLRKFMNVDVIQSLQAIMGQVTAFYRSDFEYDKRNIQKAAQSEEPDKTNLLWLCRTSGTHLHTERDVFIKGTASHNNVQFYHHDCQSEQVVLYAIEITGTKNGVVRGNLYERDRHQYAELAARGSSPYTDVATICADGHTERTPYKDYDGYVERDLKYFHGEILEVRNEAEDESVVQGALWREHERREKLPKGRISAHVEKLADQRVQTEADRIQGAFSNLKEPNSPHKTHFMVAISPTFLHTASSRDTDRLLDKLAAALKNDTLHFSGITGEKGCFCFIKADPLTQERKPSIKEQLAAPPTKSDHSPTKTKEKEVR